MGTSHVNKPSFSGRKYWLLAVDQYTKFMLYMFLKTKDCTTDKVIEILQEIHSSGKQVKFIQTDNAPEYNNIPLQLIKYNIQGIEILSTVNDIP